MLGGGRQVTRRTNRTRGNGLAVPGPRPTGEGYDESSAALAPEAFVICATTGGFGLVRRVLGAHPQLPSGPRLREVRGDLARNAGGEPRLDELWPEASFCFLLRHPHGVLAEGLAAHDPSKHPEVAADLVAQLEGVEWSRTTLPGLTLRMEDLAANPSPVSQDICRFFHVPWDRAMVDALPRDAEPTTAPVPAELPSTAALSAGTRERLEILANNWGYIV